MTQEEFQDWLAGLDVQTLTDELKETIAENMLAVVNKEREEAWYEGFDEAKEKLQHFIDNELDF